MASSTFQDTRAALATLIRNRLVSDAISGVDVFEYPPVGNVTREDQVWVGRIRVTQEPLAMGGASRKVAETLAIDLSVRAPTHGADQDDAKNAEQRAELIWKAVEDGLRESSNIGGTVMFAAVESFESVPDYDGNGAVGTIEAVITAEANL